MRLITEILTITKDMKQLFHAIKIKSENKNYKNNIYLIST